jgi:hypothetical protein
MNNEYFKFRDDGGNECKGRITGRQADRFLIRGSDYGWWFVKRGNVVKRFPNIKLATDALLIGPLVSRHFV